MKYQLYKEQQIHCDIETVWNFFSDSRNLAKITPKDMGFVVLSENADDEIYEEMIIDYTVSPLWGIPLHWRTRITQVDYLKSFTDFQEKGPYKLWNHFHEFIPNQKGVFIKDTVDYELPLGFLGRWVHPLLVKGKLEKIFAYRFQVLEEKFNK